MSIEAILLTLFFFLVAPLLEMWQARRRAQKEAEQQAREEAARRQASAARVRQSPPVQRQATPADSTWAQDIARDRLFLPEAETVDRETLPRQTISAKVAVQRYAAQQEAAAQTVSPRPAHRDAHPVADVIRGLRRTGGLQRAMVIMAVLGPCRAIEPYSWRDVDEPR